MMQDSRRKRGTAVTATESVQQDRATDINDIIKATHRYARGLDTSRPEEAIAAFTDDAYWDATGIGLDRFEGRGQILDFFRRDASATTEQYHAITNHLIEFDGPDTAHGTNYVIAEARTTSGGYIKAVAVNEDEYRRTSGGWKISARTITPLTTPQMDSFEV